MFPRAYLAQGRGWSGYDETPEERAQGGLLPDTPDDLEDPPQKEGSNDAAVVDDGSLKAMEEDSSAQEEDETSEPWIFPVVPERNSVVLLAPDGSGQVFWPLQSVPPGLLSLPPQILNAIPKADPGLLERQCVAGCLRSVLPTALPKSPLLMMLSSAAACAAAVHAGRSALEATPPTHAPYTTYLSTVIRLQQWKAAVEECVTPFHESIRPSDIYKLTRQYKRENTLQEARQNDELEALYYRNASLEEHARTWERHALEYVHLLEYFLYEALVVRNSGAPALRDMLTPSYWPNAEECTGKLREQMREDTLKFFNYKCEHAPNHGLAPALFYDQTPQGLPECPMWRGWFSFFYLNTYREYLRDSDYAPAAAAMGQAEGT